MSEYDPTKHLLIADLPEFEAYTSEGQYEGILELENGDIVGYYDKVTPSEFLDKANEWLKDVGGDDSGLFELSDVKTLAVIFYYDPILGSADEWTMNDDRNDVASDSLLHLVYLISV